MEETFDTEGESPSNQYQILTERSLSSCFNLQGSFIENSVNYISEIIFLNSIKPALLFNGIYSLANISYNLFTQNPEVQFIGFENEFDNSGNLLFTNIKIVTQQESRYLGVFRGMVLTLADNLDLNMERRLKELVSVGTERLTGDQHILGKSITVKGYSFHKDQNNNLYFSTKVSYHQFNKERETIVDQYNYQIKKKV